MAIVVLLVPYCVLAGLTALWWRIGKSRAAIGSEWSSAFIAMAVGGITLAVTLAAFVAVAFIGLILEGTTMAELRLQAPLTEWAMGIAVYGTVRYAPAGRTGRVGRRRAETPEQASRLQLHRRDRGVLGCGQGERAHLELEGHVEVPPLPGLSRCDTGVRILGVRLCRRLRGLQTGEGNRAFLTQAVARRSWDPAPTPPRFAQSSTASQTGAPGASKISPHSSDVARMSS